jgi:hypothetical protein
MDWAKYTNTQTEYVIAHPITATSVILIFAFVAGERVTELFEKQHPADFHLIFTVLIVFAPVWWAFLVIWAIRQLRHRQFPIATLNE